MQIPIDIPELLKIATDLKSVAETPLSVSVFIDDKANDALASHVRGAFAGAGAHTRVTIGYMDESPLNVSDTDDMVVFVAGDSDYIGEQAASIRNKMIPVMIVTDIPNRVFAIAEKQGHPIPEADIIAPIALDKYRLFEEGALRNIPVLGSKLSSLLHMRDIKSVQDSDVHSDVQEQNVADEQSDEVAIETSSEPIPITAATEDILNCRMGEWILVACSEKKLAFALAFPFVRKPLANDSVTSTSLQNGAIGFVPLIPGADLPIMTLNQAKMVLQISTAYGKPLDADRIKEIAAVVGGGLLFRNIARSLTKIIPFAGWIISGSVGFIGTEAMGKAVIEYFEAGGDIVGVAKVMQTARDKAIETARVASNTTVGKRVIDSAKSALGNIVTTTNK